MTRVGGTETLELRYIPLGRPGGVMRTRNAHGFGDRLKFEATLGALVYGNGRGP